MQYLKWNSCVVDPDDIANISNLYNEGYVLTRKSPGAMEQTRSVRIALKDFELSSENRRILNKVKDLKLTLSPLPLTDYHWSIGKMAKDFYEQKFGPSIMSANKVREILTTPYAFNLLLKYTNKQASDNEMRDKASGYTIAYSDEKILHYSYPFYDLASPKDTGLGMMTLAIQYAKDENKDFIYLGSLQRPGDVYKLQFSGLEWFDGKVWNKDIETVKKILSK